MNALKQAGDARVDAGEVGKLDAYLKKLFGNQRVRVVPKGGKLANVFMGEENLGELTLDDEDEDLSYNFRMVIDLGQQTDLPPGPMLTAYLRRKFDNENIRVVARPKKNDSLEAYIGEEFIGVLFVDDEDDDRSFQFQMAILEDDLVDEG
jgi:hypothetical protein